MRPVLLQSQTPSAEKRTLNLNQVQVAPAPHVFLVEGIDERLPEGATAFLDAFEFYLVNDILE